MAVAVPVPPFESFYEAHRDEVLVFLRRRLGRERADDAFQETFLRALRAYPRLEHGLHLRAWVLTIASRIVLDLARKRVPQPSDPNDDVLQGESWDGEGRPAFEELAELAAELPPKEKAAVVLRYGYDLDYAEIGAALGSSEAAARQAASAGVRRLRRRLEA
jgi:RNA polymerase sigma factor (sigma-70 family)